MDISPDTVERALSFKRLAETALDVELEDRQCVEHFVTLGIQYLVCRLVDPQKPKPSVATVLGLVDRDPEAVAGFLTGLVEGAGSAASLHAAMGSGEVTNGDIG